MSYDPLFDSDENRTLLAICTRRLIRSIGSGGVAWGILNTALGIATLRLHILNAGVAILGVMILGVGVQALLRPSIAVLLSETIVTVVLLLWNAGMMIYEYLLFGIIEPVSAIVSLIVASSFAKFYFKLRHLGPLIAEVDAAEIKATRQICKKLLAAKLKNDPSIVEANKTAFLASNATCRA